MHPQDFDGPLDSLSCRQTVVSRHRRAGDIRVAVVAVPLSAVDKVWDEMTVQEQRAIAGYHDDSTPTIADLKEYAERIKAWTADLLSGAQKITDSVARMFDNLTPEQIAEISAKLAEGSKP